VSLLPVHRNQSDWTTKNPVLAVNQPGFERETGKVKMGNGVSRWNDLPYLDVAPFTLPEETGISLGVSPAALSSSFAEAHDTDPEREGFIPFRLAASSLNALYEPLGLGFTRLRAVAIGDSTTAGNTRTTGFTMAAVNAGTNVRSYTQFMGSQGQQMAGPQSWFTYACLLSKGRLVNVYNAGLGNDRTPFMVERFPTDVVAMNPDVVFLGNAHNDFSTGSGVTEAMTRANIQQMIDMAHQAGIIPILVTNYPDNAPTPYGPPIRRHNAWLKKIAAEQSLLLIDLYAAVVDPASATGAWKATYTADGTHASSLGAQVAGQRVIDELGGLLRGGPSWLPSSNVLDVGAQLISNPLFITPSGTAGLAQSWGASGTGNTYALAADAAVLGNAQTITFANLAALARLYRDAAVDGSAVRVGDRIRWAGLFKTNGAAAGNLRWYLQFQFPGVSTYEVRPLDQLVGGIDIPNWAYFEVDAVVPVGATLWRVGVCADQGSGSVSLAQQGAYNLSKL
jgi:lysophospholipase L1-like esterase